MRDRPFLAGRLGFALLVAALAVAPAAHAGPVHAHPGQAPDPGTVVYRADRTHGWAGWKAPHWATRNGVLIGHPGPGEIRIPFVPGRHSIRDFELLIRAKAGIPDRSLHDGFSFIVRRSRLGGCSFDVDIDGDTGEFGGYGITANEKSGRQIVLDSTEAVGQIGRTETYQIQVFGRKIAADGSSEPNDSWVGATCRAGSANGYLSISDWSASTLEIESVEITAL